MRQSLGTVHGPTRGEKTAPLELYTGPVCGPEGLGGESVSNYLSQLCLSLNPVGIVHLSQTFCNPFSGGRQMQRGRM